MILGLDTTGPYCSVSVVDDVRVWGHKSEKINRGHAERLAPMVEEVLEAAGKTAADITRIAVCTGPGSFTGLRVALAFARGFALPRNLPVVGMDALIVTARRLDPEGKDRVAVQQDIRRGEFFYALYEFGKPQFPPRAMSKDKMHWYARDQWVKEIHEAHVDTRILAWLSMDVDPADYPAVPLYSRGPDAKLPGGKTL